MIDPNSESEENVPEGMKCDFCGEFVVSVRRVALDGEYDRLRKSHQILYACPSCSERKEQKRLGFERDPERT